MSDYIYMLENHLSADQNQVVEDVQTAAGQANVNLFLTGGAMRDMLAGFRIRDLDFVVEGAGAEAGQEPSRKDRRARSSPPTKTARAPNCCFRAA